MQEAYLARDIWNALDFIQEKIGNGYKGLYITRNSELGSAENFNLTNKQNIKEIGSAVKDFIEANKKSAILLDRVDYLVNVHGFDEVLKLVYLVNDLAKGKKNVFLVNVNPMAINPQQLALLKEELKELKSKHELRDDLSEIISFVAKREKVAFKDVTKSCSITKATTRKRLNELEALGMVEIKKNGRTKVVRLSERGKSTLK